MAASKHERRRPRPERFARFFTKQLLLFVACALLVIVVDLALYIVIAFQESNANFNTGSPASLVRTVDEQLARTDDGAHRA